MKMQNANACPELVEGMEFEFKPRITRIARKEPRSLGASMDIGVKGGGLVFEPRITRKKSPFGDLIRELLPLLLLATPCYPLK